MEQRCEWPDEASHVASSGKPLEAGGPESGACSVCWTMERRQCDDGRVSRNWGDGMVGGDVKEVIRL